MTSGDATSLSVADLPCACLRTSKDREILFANDYCLRHYGWDPETLKGADIASLFSHASQVFCDSYVYPQAMVEPVCAEVQLTVVTPGKERRPVMASIRQLPDGGFAWVLMEADNRNNLFRELEAAREALLEQSARLEELSRTDTLTEVLNRRGFDDGVRAVFADADRHGYPVTVLLMDIDHFKSINDRFGHAVGDEKLMALGGILRAVCRQQDLVGRLGGDEFACVLPRTEVAGARALCARIQAAVADAEAGAGGFTVSIGVAGRARGGSGTWSEVMREADRALYEAKLAGRNTTACRDPATAGVQDVGCQHSPT